MNITLKIDNEECSFSCSDFLEWKKGVCGLSLSGLAVVFVKAESLSFKMLSPFDLQKRNNDLYLKKYFVDLEESCRFYASLGNVPGRRKMKINGVRMITKKGG